jgi:hydroxymethylpyrimidine pyrophosphatase-like HAD family hydrolase
MILNHLIDIDGTITDDISNENPENMASCLPKDGAVEAINSLYRAGHTVTFFTSRTSRDHKTITEDWLKRWGFMYQKIIFDKPRGGNYIWIDNLDVQAIKYQEGYWNKDQNDRTKL